MSKPSGYSPYTLNEIKEWWQDMERLSRLGKKTTVEFEAGFQSGLQEGARRERMMFKAWMKSWLAPDYPITIEVLAINNWLASRAKPAKRKGGPDGR